MSPPEWAAVGAVVAVLGLGVTLILHIIRYSYQEGQKDQRLSHLHERLQKVEGSHADVQLLTQSLAGFGKKLDEVAHDVKNLLTGKVRVRRTVDE